MVCVSLVYCELHQLVSRQPVPSPNTITGESKKNLFFEPEDSLCCIRRCTRRLRQYDRESRCSADDG